MRYLSVLKYTNELIYGTFSILFESLHRIVILRFKYSLLVSRFTGYDQINDASVASSEAIPGQYDTEIVYYISSSI